MRILTCPICQKEFKAAGNQDRKYCSRQCMSDDYKLRLKGENNPCYKENKRMLSCPICQKEFIAVGSYKRKYCSKACMSIGYKTQMKGRVRINMIGKRFGKLIVVEMLPRNHKLIKYKCICDCGKEHITNGGTLRSGRIKSCGCLKKNPPNKVVHRTLAVYKNVFYNAVIKRSKKIQKEYDVTLQEFITESKKPCHYCNTTDSCYAKDKWSDIKIHYNGLDRVDNTKGYLKSNVVPCCKYCNMAKNTMTQQEFKDWINKIYHHYANPLP